ncbi:MAG: M20 family peptidase [Aridibacter sp.]
MLKKILIILFIFLIVLAAVLLYNTWSLKSKQLQVESLPQVKIDSQTVAGRLSQAVQIQTVSTAEKAETKAEEFQKFHRFLESSFPKIHSVLSKKTVADYSLLYAWSGTDSNLKPVILMAHQDVVPIDEATLNQWTHQPFSGDVADGFIWGRGTRDNKSRLLSIFESIEMLLNENFQPKRTIYLAFGHDEEIGGKNGAAQIAKLLRERGVNAEFVLDEGGGITDKILKGIDSPVAMVGIAEKGYLSLELTVEDAGGHSSSPPKSTTIGILSKAINRLEENPFPGGIRGVTAETLNKIAPEMSFGQKFFLSNLWLFRPLVERQFSSAPQTSATLRTTTAVTMFNAGVKDNILPNRATAVVNFRIMPGDTAESVTEYVRQTINDDRVKISSYGENAWSASASPVSDVNSASFQNIEKVIRQTFPDTFVSPFLGLGATDSRYFTQISPNIYRFSPLKSNSEDLKRLHGINERISVEDYSRGIGFYYNLIKNLE